MTSERGLRGPGLNELPASGLDAGWLAPVVPLAPKLRSLPRTLPEGDDPGFPPEPIHVLVVEGSEEDFLLVQDLLGRAEDSHFVLQWAASVESAVARLAGGDFQVCLCDHGLPHRDGLELVRMARRRGCRTPVILTTSFAGRDLEREAIEAGVVELIEKEEFDTQRLDRAIRFAAARQARAERLNRLARLDELTGLASRSLFGDRLERALAGARRRRLQAAVLIIDLDGFKAVNDRHGHGIGDQLLCSVGQRLCQRLRETDTVARLGGDEFAVLLENLAGPQDAALVAAKLLDAIAPPVEIEGVELLVGASIGAALFPGDGSDAASLLRHADAAMYRAKAQGGSLCCFHDAGLDTRTLRGAGQGAGLRRAIEQGELQLRFQPQVTLASPDLGLAALIEWRPPDSGAVEGERLRQLAEEAGLIEPLTEWLIASACAQARRWREQGLRRLHLALPLLSRRQLGWSGLAARLDAALAGAGLPPHGLELEIGELALLDELSAGGHALQPLRELGVRLALDRFGAGQASLNVIRDAPLSTLKLSRDLLRGTPGDHHRSLFAGAVIGLAKHLRLRLVAEGIESQAQLKMLKSQGCDAVQAFISCPPLSADACTDWLHQAAQRG